MSAGRFRIPTNAQRRAARRRSQRTARRSPPWPWLALSGVAVLAVSIAAVIWVASRSGGAESGEPASNVAPGSGTSGELAQIRTSDFHSLAISPEDPDIMLYGHHGGILRSTDGGRTWQTTSLGGSGDDAMGMAFAGTGGNTVFAAGHDTFFRSDDAGFTWKRVRPDLPATDMHGFAAAPDDPNRLYAYVTQLGLYRSSDGGDTWTRAATTLPGDVMTLSAGPGGRVYAGSMQSGVLRSDDGGAAFNPTGAGPVAVMSVAAAASDRDVVYAGSQSALLLSTDGGASWQERTVPGGGQVMIAAVSPADPMDVTVVSVQGDRAGHVFRSRDGGVTWGSG